MSDAPRPTLDADARWQHNERVEVWCEFFDAAMDAKKAPVATYCDFADRLLAGCEDYPATLMAIDAVPYRWSLKCWAGRIIEAAKVISARRPRLSPDERSPDRPTLKDWPPEKRIDHQLEDIIRLLRSLCEIARHLLLKSRIG